MALQLDNVLREIAGQPPVRDVPQLDGAVLGRAGDDVVVERVPFDVKDLTAVTRDLEINVCAAIVKKRDTLLNARSQSENSI